MLGIKYLIRLDDACPTMDSHRWNKMESLLDRYGVKPMVGIIPHNEDNKQMIEAEDSEFWYKVNKWKQKGWTIAMHGYNHCYKSDQGLKGINPMWSRSEFAGLSLDEQKNKIRNGIFILKKYGINPNYFFAPSHTFDKNTLMALKEESEIRIISDTIAFKPYKYKDFVFIPQFGGHCSKMWFPGVYTFCFHPSVMNDDSFSKLDSFLSKYSSSFVSFVDLNIQQYGNKGLMDRILTLLYFSYRRLRGIH